MVKPYFLDSMTKFTFVELDREIADLVGLARSQASNFGALLSILVLLFWLGCNPLASNS